MFNRKNRINKEVLSGLMSKKNLFSCDFFVVKGIENNLEIPRFAVVVSKKVSKLSVKRHLYKRIFIEIIRKRLFEFKNMDFLFILSPEIIKIDRKEIDKIIQEVLNKNKVSLFKNL